MGSVDNLFSYTPCPWVCLTKDQLGKIRAARARNRRRQKAEARKAGRRGRQ